MLAPAAAAPKKQHFAEMWWLVVAVTYRLGKVWVKLARSALPLTPISVCQTMTIWSP